MSWIGIDWHNPLILLRVYLTTLWVITAGYSVWAVIRIPRKSFYWPLTLYTVLAGMMGAVSYFLGATTMFSSFTGFIVVAALLTFTPVSLIAWQVIAIAAEKRLPSLPEKRQP